MRAPRSVSASAAFDASSISPPPVNPEPWKNSDSPRPRTGWLRGLSGRAGSRGQETRRAPSLEVRALHRLAQDLQRAAVCPKTLAGGGGIARAQRVDLAHAHRIEPQRLGDAVHVDFGRKLRLRRTEAAKRAVGRRVGHAGAAANAHVIAAVRTARVDHAARQHHGAQGRVGAAVEDRVDLDRRQPAVAGDAGLVADGRRVPLGRGDHVLDAVVDQLDRPAGLLREQRRVPGDHRRVLFLAAEPAAGLRLHHADLVARQIRAAPSAPGARSTDTASSRTR